MSWFGFHTHYATWELRAMRFFFSALIWVNLQRPPAVSAPYPHGVAHLVDLTFLADPRVFAVLKGFMLVPFALFVWGRWMALALSYMLALWVGSWSLVLSDGAMVHSSQLVGLVLVALWLGYAVGPWLRRRSTWQRPDLTVDDLATYWVLQIIAAAYLLAGISKVVRSGLHFAPLMPRWIVDVEYIPVQVAKTWEEWYYAVLDPRALERSHQIAGFFAAHPDLTRVFFSGGLFLELVAVLLLINRAWAAGMGVALFMMHVMIGLTMQVGFTMNRFVVLIFLVNVPYWAVVAARHARLRIRGTAVATPDPAPT